MSSADPARLYYNARDVPMPSALTRRRAIRRLALFVAGSPLLRAQFNSREGHQRIPSLDEMASVFEFEPVARAKITQRAYDYIAGGVESEFSLRRNREAYDWVTLIPRAMRDVSSIDLSTEVLGQRLDYPILIAPTAGHQQLHSNGEQETCRGASAAGAVYVISNNASFPLDKIASAADGVLWTQHYIRGDLGRSRERVEQAMAIGSRAICLTVDTQWGSLRERLLHDRHLSQRPRQEPRARRRRGRAEQEPDYPHDLQGQDADLDWSILEKLRSWSDLPLLLKGVLTAEDARLAVERGADAIVVSNHGARYLSYAPATLEMLPEIVAAVEGRVPVLIDGGIRRGSDVLKALALGAKAVLVGRPSLWGLGAFAAEGVQRVLDLLRAELALAMAHTGCSSIAQIGGGLVETDFP